MNLFDFVSIFDVPLHSYFLLYLQKILYDSVDIVDVILESCFESCFEIDFVHFVNNIRDL